MKRSQSFLATALALSIIAFSGCTNDNVINPEAPQGSIPTVSPTNETKTAAAELQAEQAAAGVETPEAEDATDITTTPNGDGYEWVDLGLKSGTLWAKCNIGAKSPEEFGSYFAWGETEAKTPMPAYNPEAEKDIKDYVNWATYKYCQEKDSTMTKYCSNEWFGTVDGLDTLDIADDAAAAIWGEEWQIPTPDDFYELITEANTKGGVVTMSWAQVNRVPGIKFTNTTNMASIFFPAGGYRYNYGHDCRNFAGMYWTNTLNAKDNNNWARVFYFTYTLTRTGSNERCYGLNIRPIRKKN